MKTMTKPRILSFMMAVLLCGTMLATPAFADGMPPEEASPAVTPAATVKPGEPLSEETGISTRDLLYDKETNKQFITVTDREGNIFYLVIDYDAPTNEEEEQYKTYFLNPVDTADLMALAEETQTTPPACSCTEKCVVGSINTACEVCGANMTECAGKTPQPEATPEPVIEEEPQNDASGMNPAAILVLLALAGGGGAFALYKMSKNKPQTRGQDDLDEYDYGEDEDEAEVPWENEGEAEDEDSGENTD